MDLAGLPSPFYRVSVKALVFDAQRRLLVFKNPRGCWEMPGGGWEHGESLDACIRRELMEEVRAQVSEVGAISFAYQCKVESGGFTKLCLAVRVTLTDQVLAPVLEEVVAAQYVTQQAFQALQFDQEEMPIMSHSNQIWLED